MTQLAATDGLPVAVTGMARPADGVPDVAGALVEILHHLGVREAFGVCGGAIARMWAALLGSPIETFHCRHESGAAFAAIEASLAGDRPAVVFTTTGPGLTNAITGVSAARGEGARLILLSPRSAPALRGRSGIQEVSDYDGPLGGLLAAGSLFDMAVCIDSADELPQLATRLAGGLARPGGFVGHLILPINVQGAPAPAPAPAPAAEPLSLAISQVGPTPEAVAQAAKALRADPFAVWLGRGAVGAVTEVRDLVAQTGAPVLCSPRAKGIVPDRHPQFVGVTGLGGHESARDLFSTLEFRRALVIGSRLGEQTSGWDPALVPPDGFVHVDIDPTVFGTAFPGVPTVGVLSDATAFLRALIAGGHLPQRSFVRARSPYPPPPPYQSGGVHPAAILAAVQRIVLEQSDATVISDLGAVTAWAPHHLRVDDPRRWRLPGRFASMGHGTAGVLGVAVARRRRAVCLTGDGALLMTNEISTAATYGLPVVWVVFNDGRYGMAATAMRLSGDDPAPAIFKQCDFVSVARGMGGDGQRVADAADLDGALRAALASDVPFVVDVLIDPDEVGPFATRLRTLEVARG